MDALDGRFVVLYAAGAEPVPAAVVAALDDLARGPLPLVWRAVTDRRNGQPNELVDSAGRIRERYDLTPGSVYLIRPDQHVAARWRAFDAAALSAALNRAVGR